ncbi:STAS/SEC14 domain-containing protein [Chondromyces crocatus]|uniref:STAS/SEC14 domain-containing protein n=1 Tax=Chondromyces crocatus TaxID=52 RepID=A0A0K1E9W4_CHOCO|nr:STAS/SEC14 domain-containing protein [Chondromyces crocatus]AKT37477.1 uncharacterized protein CMC5_016180 [Chondromyces crocatus]
MTHHAPFASPPDGLPGPESSIRHAERLAAPESSIRHADGLAAPASTPRHADGLAAPASTPRHADGLAAPESTPLDTAEVEAPASLPPDLPREWYFGRHSMHFEPPDLQVVVLEGEVSADDIQFIADANRPFYEQASLSISLILLKSVAVASPGTRKAVASNPMRPIPHVLAFVGGSFATRVVTTVVLRAANLITPGKTLFAFFDDEKPAREWIDARRRELSSRAATPAASPAP